MLGFAGVWWCCAAKGAPWAAEGEAQGLPPKPRWGWAFNISHSSWQEKQIQTKNPKHNRRMAVGFGIIQSSTVQLSWMFKLGMR